MVGDGTEGGATIAQRQQRRDIVAWVGSHIIPHEAEARARLRRQAVPEAEIGDVIQDAYLALARLDCVAHIHNPRAYFFAAARNALLQRLRRNRIVRIDSLTDSQALAVADDEPGPERQVTGRMELARVHRLIDALPDRCREIFLMRRIRGLPQREIAAIMGVSEEVVEAQAIRGLKLILKAIEGEEQTIAAAQASTARDRQDDDRYRQP